MGAPAPDPLNSNCLLAAAQAGDGEAFGQLTQRYRAYLLGVAGKVLGYQHAHDRSSVVQNGLVAAWRYFAQFRGTTAAEFLAWLVRIVKNKALDRVGGRVAMDPLPDNDAAAGALAVADTSPSDEAMRRERTAGLLAALDRLSEGHREVINLRNLQELPFPIVAVRMNRSHAAVRKLWCRAVAQLADILGDEP